MLACVCQPTDTGIFRRSPIPLGAPPLKLNSLGVIPKPGRTLRVPVITSEPSAKSTQTSSSDLSEGSSESLELTPKIKTKTAATNTITVVETMKITVSCSPEVKINKDPEKALLDQVKESKISPRSKIKHHLEGVHRITRDEPSIKGIKDVQVQNGKTSGGSFRSKTRRVEKVLLDAKNNVGSNLAVSNGKKEDTLEDTSGGNAKENEKKQRRKSSDFEKLPDGVQLTLNELREMACRQQAQIDSQHQLLAAKEQRLRYLKEQEAHQQRVQAESERLRRLRDRVDAQEMKLRKLRAIRGQVDHQKQNNISLTSDLDSIRALFNEKEKELSLAVAKVEELTRQLEELRRGRSARDQPPASALELDKLRRELMYRNKLNEQQNQRLNQQREALTARQEEMSAIDKRISELQERLHRKRLLNQQLANQISAASHKAAYHQLVRLTTGSADQTNQGYGARKPSQTSVQPPNGLSRTNIAAVEPYNHVPLPNGHQNRNAHGNQENTTYHPVYQQNHHIKSESDQIHNQENQEMTNKISNVYTPRTEDGDLLKEFSVSKSDPKYQTLPYNTKFTVNLIPTRMNNRATEANDNNANSNENKDADPAAAHHISTHPSSNGNVQSQQQHMTVHSAPLSIINKNIATPLNQNDLLNRKLSEQGTNNANNNGETRGAFSNGVKLQTSDSNPPVQTPPVPSYQKPISSVAPTSVHHSGKLSNIYQTSSIKVQPVEPQTISNQKQPPQPPNIPQTSYSSPQSIALSPPQSTSTPLGTPEVSIDKTPKPALPPKPAIKPPPRQTHVLTDNDHSQPPPIPSSEPPDDTNKPPPITPQKPSQTMGQAKPGIFNQPQPSLGQKGYAPPPSSSQSNLPLTHQQPPTSTQSSNQPPLTTPSISHNLQTSSSTDNMPIIKAKPLTIKKQPLSEQPKLRTLSSYSKLNGLSITKRRIEIPPAFHFPELSAEKPSSDAANGNQVQISANDSPKDGAKSCDESDKAPTEETDLAKDKDSKSDMKQMNESVVRRCKKGNLKQTGKTNLARRVSFDPLALLLDASLEGELELVKKTATQVTNPSAANDEGITALHNAICAGHLEIVKFLVEFGCDVNAQDSDGWTPLHCAASCNNVAMVRFLVEHGACIFATTLSDHETAAEKCEEDEEGFDGCSEYLYSVQEKLGILSGGAVYAVFDYTAQQPDELSFKAGQQLTILRKGDESEREWWWSRLGDTEGYVPRNLLGLYPRVSRSEE